MKIAQLEMFSTETSKISVQKEREVNINNKWKVVGTVVKVKL